MEQRRHRFHDRWIMKIRKKNLFIRDPVKKKSKEGT